MGLYMKSLKKFALVGAMGGALIASFAMPAAAGDTGYPKNWGPDDELGSFNILKPEMAAAAAKLVTTGKSYALSIDSSADTPAGAGLTPREYRTFIFQPGQPLGRPLAKNGFGFLDDVVYTWQGVGTQIDGLAHVGVNNVFYNDVKLEDFVKVSGVSKFSTHALPPVVTRGLMFDAVKYKGVDFMKQGEVISLADLKGMMKAQGVSPREGDVVLFNTGWIKNMDKVDPAIFARQEPGIGIDIANYLIDLGVVAIGADTFGLEVIPPEDPDSPFPAHIRMLQETGTYVLENIRTEELADDEVYEFMFVLGVPKLVGTVQGIITPVAVR